MSMWCGAFVLIARGSKCVVAEAYPWFCRYFATMLGLGIFSFSLLHIRSILLYGLVISHSSVSFLSRASILL